MKILTKLCAFTLLIIVIVIGCRRTFSNQDFTFNENTEFTSATIRKWYYTTYRKSEEYKTAWSLNKKMPDWNNGTSYKRGSLHFLEFPLLKEKTALLIGKDTVLTASQASQIVNASLSRVLFIRTPNNQVVVREVNYVPNWDYLQKHDFDISQARYQQSGDDFTGTLIIKDWNGNILSMRRLKDGKIVRLVSTERTNSTHSQHQREMSCQLVEYCMWYEDCEVVGDVMTDNCGEPYMDPTDCYWQEECTGGEEEDPCTLYGIGCGGGGGNEDPPPPPPDPCEDAKPGADKATSFSQNSTYNTAKSNIQAAASDGNEHGISFGKNTNGVIITSTMSNGGDHSGTVGNVDNVFADLHNHPGNSPPSSGDFYGFIDRASAHNTYETRYVVTPNGTVYALVVTNLQAAQAFNTTHPRVNNPGYEPGFPDGIVDEINEMKGFYGATDEMAMAFILEKYNTGIALLKQDSNGNFKRLNTKETTVNGQKNYAPNNCQ